MSAADLFTRLLPLLRAVVAEADATERERRRDETALVVVGEELPTTEAAEAA